MPMYTSAQAVQKRSRDVSLASYAFTAKSRGISRRMRDSFTSFQKDTEKSTRIRQTAKTSDIFEKSSIEYKALEQKYRFSKMRLDVENLLSQRNRNGPKCLYLPKVLGGVYKFRERCCQPLRLVGVHLHVYNVYNVIN